MPGFPRHVRVTPGRPRVLPGILHLLKSRAQFSGIEWHTPYSAHIGIQDKRQAMLNAACAANQRRCTSPMAPEMPAAARINKPVTDSDTQQHPSLETA